MRFCSSFLCLSYHTVKYLSHFLKICYDALTKYLLVSFFDPQKILYPFSLSFFRYCTRSCLTIMAGVSVVHKLIKKQQENDNNSNQNSATSVKLFTSSPQWQAYQATSLPNPSSLYFGLNPINCLHRDSFGCKPIPSCNCPGEERKFQPVHICMRSVILKGVGSGTPVISTLRQVPILVNSD